MVGLRSQESTKFKKYFELVQEEAQKINPDLKEGDTVDVEIIPFFLNVVRVMNSVMIIWNVRI